MLKLHRRTEWRLLEKLRVTSTVRELLRSKSSLTVLMGHAHATQWRTKSSSRRQLSWLRELDQRGGLKKCNFLWVFWHLEFLLNKIFFAWKITSFLIKNEGTPPYAWFNWSRWSTRIVSILPYMVLVNQDEWTHPNDQPESLQYFLYMFPDSWPDPSRTDQEWGNHLNWSGMREPCPNVLQNTHWAMVPSFLNWSLCVLFKNKGTWCKSPNKWSSTWMGLSSLITDQIIEDQIKKEGTWSKLAPEYSNRLRARSRVESVGTLRL